MTARRNTCLRDAARTARMHVLLRTRNCLPGRSRQESNAMLEEEGTTVVETAVTLGVLLMFVIALIHIFLAVYSYHSVSQLAREATRYAIVRGSKCVGLTGCNASNDTIQTYLRGLKYPGIVAGNLTTNTNFYRMGWDTSGTPPTATWTSCSSCNDPGNQVQVQVFYKYQLNILMVPTAKLTLTSTSTMVISQ